MSSGASENPGVHPPGAAHRVRVIVFRVVAALAGLFFVLAVVLMASAPWVLLQPDQTTRTELNRWFLTVAGSVDAIAAGVLLALALRPHRTLLIVEHTGAVIVAGAIILPFQPSFAAILAIGVVPLIAYPYWREVRTFPSWWAGMSRALLILAVLAGAGLLVTAAMAIPRQIGGTDQAAHGGWWSDYAEHATVLALAGVLAASRGPGCRILRGLCSGVWLYLGLVAALVLPHHPGSWGRVGGAAALVVGVGFGTAAWRGREREMTPSPDWSSNRDLPQGTATP
jgi:hypothetical protein